MIYKREITFLHIADVHLGMAAEEGLYPRCDRRSEIKERFWKILDICQQEKIDFLLICGDLFHHDPSQRLLEEVDLRFASLLYTQVMMIMGNHDCLSKHHLLTNYQWSKNVYVFKAKEGEVIQLKGIYFYGMSYAQPQYTQDIYEVIKPQSFLGTHILLAHGGDQLHAPFSIAKMERKGFDYVALGHIHEPYLGRKVAYSGSLTPLHRLEQGERGYIQGKISKRGQIFFEWKALEGRVYYELELPVDKEETYTSLEKKMKKMILTNGYRNLYVFNLVGEMSKILKRRLFLLKKLGLIVDIELKSPNNLRQKKESSSWVEEVLEKRIAKGLENDMEKDRILKKIRKAIYQR